MDLAKVALTVTRRPPRSALASSCRFRLALLAATEHGTHEEEGRAAAHAPHAVESDSPPRVSSGDGRSRPAVSPRKQR